MKRITHIWMWIVLFSLAACWPSAAQTTTGAVRGTITDPSGAIVPSAKVTVTNTATGVSNSTVTNQAGDYSIRFLQIGQYKLNVEANGFKTSTYGPFALEIDQTAKIDLALSIGETNTTVTVSDQFQPILQTENSTNGETFTENTINSVPLNGRDFSQLTVFTPGAVSTNYGQFGGAGSAERNTGHDTIPNVNGNRQQSNNYLLDGQEINENINNTIGYTPSPDSLEQMRVIASNANAEFGNVNGGQVVMVMKSGTNSYHGSVFGFLESHKLDANSWTNDFKGVQKNPFTQTIFGGTFGGPILKDKLFFFVDYQGYRWHTGGTDTVSVAPAAFRTGDLSALLPSLQLYDTQNAGGPVPYANNKVPITNPVALYLFAHPEVYPLPNKTAGDALGILNNYVGPTGKVQKNDQGDVKIDWHLHQNDVISARYSQGYAQDSTTKVPIAVQFPSASNYPDKLFTLNETHTFSAAIVNQFRASYSRIRFNSGVTTDPSGVFGLTGNSVVGIPSKTQLSAGFSQQNFSNANYTGTGTISNFGANPTPEIFIDNVFEYADNLTWQHGRHLFKFGAQFTRYQQNSFYPGNDGELGYFSYTGQYTASPGKSSVTYGFADFLTDRVYEAAVGAVTGRTGQRQWRDAFYAQDDYKILPNLTLNLGLRYEYDQPIYEVNNKQANLDLNTGQILYAGVNGASRALYDSVYTNIMPRVGLAYQVKPRFVIRAGYGISNYLEGTGANLRLTQNPPFHSDFDEIGQAPGFTGTVYSPGIHYSASSGFPTTTAPVTTFYAWKKNLQPAFIHEYTLAVEYQLAAKSSLSVGYVGEAGHHLTDPAYGNQLKSPTSTAPYANIVGQGGVVKITASDSSMNYNALQMVFRQRLAAGLELTANYTYSKSLTDDIGYYGVSNIQQQYYQQDVYNLAAEWGPSGADVRHALSVTGTYALPFGRGKMFGGNVNGFLDQIFGGWKLSGSSVTYTGFPVTITSPANYSSKVYAYTGAARPNQFQKAKIVNQSRAHWFGTDPAMNKPCAADVGNGGNCVYGLQSSTAFGSVRPGSLRAPGFQNVDMAVAKSFGLWREHKFDFRADFFNAFNIASYGNPDNGVSDTNFGEISNTRSTERHIQLSMKYAF